MSRHFGLPIYSARVRESVPLRKIGWAALVTFLGLSLLSFSVFWLKYRPRGVDRYAPAFSEQSISMTVSTAYEAYPICFTSEQAFTEAGRVK